MGRIKCGYQKAHQHSNESGQATIEAILIVVILLSISLSAINVMRDQGYIDSFTKGPWEYTAGMIENGVWSTPREGRNDHPEHKHRHSTNQEG